MFALHTGKGKSIAQTIEYIENPDKTRNGELVSGYQCNIPIVDAEFLLSKDQYADIARYSEIKNDVLAYHIRQSFKPGEITPELANELGRELAMRFTKNNHAFIVATHIDKKHIHNHIIFNSTNLNCDGKFRDFKQSGRAIRRISDQICFEHGLSVIENPKPSHGHYGTWLGDKKKPTMREQLQQTIDTVLDKKPVDFNEFLKLMESVGYEIKRGKNISFRGKENKRFIRLRSLKDDYTEDAIRERIEGKRTIKPKEKTTSAHQPQVDNLLMQIQRCVKSKGSPGYDRWAAVFNLKQLAKSFNFLQENNLLEYEKLSEKAQQAKDDFNAISTRIKTIDSRLPEIISLQKHIGIYSKTKDIYAEYRNSKWDKKFYAANKEKIEMHKETKKAFDALGLAKLPTIKMLQTEYATLQSEKNSLWAKFKPAREYMHEILIIKQNVEKLFNHSDNVKIKQNERT